MADEQSWSDLILPFAVGATSLAGGFAAGRNPGVDNPGATFLQAAQIPALIEQRLANVQHQKDIAGYYQNLHQYQQSENARKQQEQAFKQNEEYRKAVTNNQMRQQLGLPALPLPMTPQGSPPAMGQQQAPPSFQQGQGSPQASMGQAPPFMQGGMPSPMAQSQGGVATQAPPAGVGRSMGGYSQEFEVNPAGEVTQKFKPTVPLDDLGKTVRDYEEFLAQSGQLKQTNPAQFNLVDTAFQNKIGQMSRVQYTDPRAKLAQDIQFLQVAARGNPAMAQVAHDLQREYQIQQIHGTAESPIGKLIKDRAYFKPGSPEYKMMTDALTKETNPSSMDNRLTLTNQYVRASGDFFNVKDNFIQMATAYQDSLKNPGSGVNDSTMIFSYMKMVDPTSVVREGEFDRMTNISGVPGFLRNYFAPDGKLIQGVILPPEARAKLLQGGQGVYTSRLQGQFQKEQLYRTMAANMRMPPETIVPISGHPASREQATQALTQAGGNISIASAILVAQGLIPPPSRGQ